MELQANGITMAYALEGRGTPVTLIHALGLDHHVWWPQVPVFSQQFRTLAYDVRGHGQSDKPAGPYSLSLFAADLRALLDALGIRRTHVMGISMGGMIAQALAVAHPDLVRSLILVDTSSEYAPEARQSFAERAALAESEGLSSVVPGLIERWFTAPFRERCPEIVDYFRQAVLRNDPRAYAASIRAVGDLDYTNQLNRLRCPALVVVGEQDLGTTPAMAELIHRHIQGSRLLVIPHAAHLTPVEQAQVFNAAVLEFLAGVEKMA